MNLTQDEALDRLRTLATKIDTTVAQRDERLARRNERITALIASGLVSRAIAEPTGLTASRIRQIAHGSTRQETRRDLTPADHMALEWLGEVRTGLDRLEVTLANLRDERDELIAGVIADGYSVRGAASAAGVGRSWAVRVMGG